MLKPLQIKHENKVRGDRISLMFLAALACFFGSAAVIIMVESGRAGSMNGFKASLKPKLIELENVSNKTWYNCKFTISDKGNRENYQAFFIHYTERDCRFIDNLQTQYDCVVFNKANRYMNYDKSRNWSVVSPKDKIQIPWTNFFKGQTEKSLEWPRYNPEKQIYSMFIECQRSSGGKSAQTIIFKD